MRDAKDIEGERVESGKEKMEKNAPTEEEILWQMAMRGVDPMVGKNPPHTPAARTSRRATAALTSPPVSKPASLDPGALLSSRPEPAANAPLPRKIRIEAKLDLHGLSQRHAHETLNRFILDCHRRDIRFVLVITGKGRSARDAEASDTMGVLRRRVPEWLQTGAMGQIVRQIHPAGARHGGAGAFYILLRRNRAVSSP